MTAGLSWQVQHFAAAEASKQAAAHHAHKASNLAPKTAHPPIPRATP
jgi:hypothetical protein